MSCSENNKGHESSHTCACLSMHTMLFFLYIECIQSIFHKQVLISLGHTNEVSNRPIWLQGQRSRASHPMYGPTKPWVWKTMKVYCDVLVRHGLEVILLIPNYWYGSRCFVPKQNKNKKHFNKNTVHGIGYVKTRWSFEFWRQQKKMHLNSQSPRETNSNHHSSVFGDATNRVVWIEPYGLLAIR